MGKKENHPFRLNRNISTLDKQIRSKEELIQKVIDKKHALRQTYLEAMEDARKSESNQESRIQSSQQDFISAMDRLDEEEEYLALREMRLSIKNLIWMKPSQAIKRFYFSLRRQLGL